MPLAGFGPPSLRSRVLAVGHEMRLSSLWGKVKELLAGGAIGKPLYALIELWRKPYRLGADGWRYDVRGGYGYLDASYGYDGRYLGYDQYRYYFRQGYERGYADGYYAQDRYARRDGDDLAIAAAVVVAILGLQQLL